MSMERKVLHQCTSFFNSKLCGKLLPFIPALRKHHPDGGFSLVADPSKSKITSIIGMFVLRPSRTVFPRNIPEVMLYGKSLARLMYEDHDWVYNVDGLDGGRLISNCSAVDAYRYKADR